MAYFLQDYNNGVSALGAELVDNWKFSSLEEQPIDIFNVAVEEVVFSDNDGESLHQCTSPSTLSAVSYEAASDASLQEDLLGWLSQQPDVSDDILFSMMDDCILDTASIQDGIPLPLPPEQIIPPTVPFQQESIQMLEDILPSTSLDEDNLPSPLSFVFNSGNVFDDQMADDFESMDENEFYNDNGSEIEVVYLKSNSSGNSKKLNEYRRDKKPSFNSKLNDKRLANKLAARRYRQKNKFQDIKKMSKLADAEEKFQAARVKVSDARQTLNLLLELWTSSRHS